MSGSRERTGVKGSRKESQFAAILGRAGWLVDGPRPRTRFGRTDAFGLFDLLALREASPHLFVQLTDSSHGAEKRDDIDASPLFGDRLARSANDAILVGTWGRRQATGFAWKIEKAYGRREWRVLGFVSLAGDVVDTNGGTLTRLLATSKEAKQEE